MKSEVCKGLRVQIPLVICYFKFHYKRKIVFQLGICSQLSTTLKFFLMFCRKSPSPSLYKEEKTHSLIRWDKSAPIMGNERFIFWFWESPTTGLLACKVKKHFHCLIKQRLWAQCCFVYSVTRETALQNRHLVAKNEFAFSFRPKRKDQQVGGQYANVSC